MKNNKIAFIKMGAFSHTNQNVYNMLKKEFPDINIDVIDIWEDIVQWKSLQNLMHAFLEHGIKIFYTKKNFINSLIYNTYIFKETKKRIGFRLENSNYLFTFQTQSIFDCSVNGIPHFLYTDHTVLENKQYPDFDFDKQIFSAQWLKLEKSIYDNASICFTMSSNISKSIIEQYKCDQNKVICAYAGPNSSLPKTFNKNRVLDKTQNILFVGVDWERKGGPTLIKAFEIILKTHPEATLTIVGCNPKIKIHNCNVVGKVPLSQVGQYYENASIFCLPTNLEPFGLVFLEAMSFGLPIVATNIGAIPDFIDEGKNGYKVEPKNPKKLANKLLLLLNDPVKCEKFGQYGHKLFTEKYSWVNVGKIIHKNIQPFLV